MALRSARSGSRMLSRLFTTPSTATTSSMSLGTICSCRMSLWKRMCRSLLFSSATAMSAWSSASSHSVCLPSSSSRTTEQSSRKSPLNATGRLGTAAPTARICARCSWMRLSTVSAVSPFMPFSTYVATSRFSSAS